jgi:hypothetical protein
MAERRVEVGLSDADKPSDVDLEIPFQSCE